MQDQHILLTTQATKVHTSLDEEIQKGFLGAKEFSEAEAETKAGAEAANFIYD